MDQEKPLSELVDEDVSSAVETEAVAAGMIDSDLLVAAEITDQDHPELILDFEQAPTSGATSPADSGVAGLMRWDEALNLEAQVEAILFAAPKPISVQEVRELLEEDGEEPASAMIEAVISNLLKLYRERNGGFRLEHEKGVGYQFRTVPAAAPLMERMFSSRQRPLSRAALETLAILAYRQPVTRADIEAIRGVDAGSIIKNLMDRELISCVGRKEDSGRPMMFGTSPEFLRVFRIANLDELPPLSAFQPAPETLSEAEDRLEMGGEVDVYDFMRDIDEAEPLLSPGLEEGAKLGEFPHLVAEFEVRDPHEVQDLEDAIPEPESPFTGARYDVKGFHERDSSEREDDTDPEVAFPAGSSLTPGSGENADGGQNLDKRQSGEGTRDPD